MEKSVTLAVRAEKTGQEKIQTEMNISWLVIICSVLILVAVLLARSALSAQEENEEGAFKDE